MLQIAAIREASQVLKDEIQGYLRDRNTQAEEYTAELLCSQEKIEDIQREIASELRDTPISDLIIQSKERQQRIADATQMVLKRCHLEERVLADKSMFPDFDNSSCCYDYSISNLPLGRYISPFHCTSQFSASPPDQQSSPSARKNWEISLLTECHCYH